VNIKEDMDTKNMQFEKAKTHNLRKQWLLA